MYSKIYLRLEPLGLELVAAAIRNAGHEVQLIDLQAETDRDYFRIIDQWQPDVIAFSCNYLANIPEILDLAKATRAKLRQRAHLRRRPQRVLHRRANPRARRRRD